MLGFMFVFVPRVWPSSDLEIKEISGVFLCCLRCLSVISISATASEVVITPFVVVCLTVLPSIKTGLCHLLQKEAEIFLDLCYA